MATVGDVLFKIRQAGIEKADDVDFVVLNADGDEVPLTIVGYVEDDDQFVIQIGEFEVNAPIVPDSAAKKQIVQVSVPEGVDVDIIHLSAVPDDDSDI